MTRPRWNQKAAKMTEGVIGLGTLLKIGDGATRESGRDWSRGRKTVDNGVPDAVWPMPNNYIAPEAGKSY